MRSRLLAAVALTGLGWCAVPALAAEAGDIDGDGDTDQADLGALLARYGEDC